MPLDDLIASFSPDGRDFERLCRWLLESVPEYRVRLAQVWLWNDWPDREGRPDAGIDLVARERGGGLWAIQAKQYDPAYAIKKADVDSFLAESARTEFAYRLLIATTDHLGPTARRTLDHQEKPVGTILRSDLKALGIGWPHSVDRLTPPRAKPKRPRPHQRRAVRAVAEDLSRRNRGQLVMACGTGKTLTARFLHDELGAQRTLVLVPSLSLVKQTIREWFSVGDFDYLAVCSDDTVAPNDTDAVVASTSELGVPVTTDPVEIRAFLCRRDVGARVVFGTYQSSQRIADAQAGRTPLFDLVVADEAHRCAGSQAGAFATVLDSTKIKARKRLFMTATPRYFTGRLKEAASDADWEVASMDDEAKFGPVSHRLTFAQAIEQDLLSDYRVVVVGVTHSTYRDYAERGVFVTPDGETVTDARTLASQLGLLRAMRKHDLRRVVTFHSRIRTAREFGASLPEVWTWMPPRRRPTGRLWTRHVSGEMSSGEREARLNRLREIGSGERGVLTNARCLTEGIDVPTLDGVAFIDPRRSQVDIVQAVGRAIRRADDKTVGTIVLPVFVDEGVDPEDALESGEFDHVWEVVKALRSHDEKFADELDELRRERGRRRPGNGRPRKIFLDLPVGVGSDFERAFDARVVETSTAAWEFWFGLLEQYVDANQDALVPAVYPIEVDGKTFDLGRWVHNQRTRHDSLPQSRVSRLDALRNGDGYPVWAWDGRDAIFLTKCNQLREFIRNHARIPKSTDPGSAGALARWFLRLRDHPERVTPERRVVLDAIYPDWQQGTHDRRFALGLSHYRTFRRTTGRAIPGASETIDGFPVGRWWRNAQRSPERCAQLEAEFGPDVFRDVSHADEVWEDFFAHLVKFNERFGHVRVRQDYIDPDDSFPLGVRVNTRRTEGNSGRMKPEQQTLLDTFPTWVWNARQAEWLESSQTYERWLAEGGERRPRRGTRFDGIDIGSWASKAHAAAKKPTTPAWKLARLQELGIPT